MSLELYRAGILPAGVNKILPPRLEQGQLFYAPLLGSLAAIGGGDVTPTFTRASTATAHTPGGKLQNIPTGTPRFERHGMKFEGVRTNLAPWSEDLSNPVWVPYNSTVVTNALASPYVGSPVIADKLEETVVNDFHSISNPYTGVANQKDTMSVYVHGGERTWVYIGWIDSAGGFIDCHFNTATGTYGTINVGGAGISITDGPRAEALADGWYWLTVTVQTAANTARSFDCGLLQGDGVTTYVGTPGWGAYFIGAQAEANAAFPSSYIPNLSGVTNTRQQDRLTYPAAGNTPTTTSGSLEIVVRRAEIGAGSSPMSTQDAINQFGAEILMVGGAGAFLGNVITTITEVTVVGVAYPLNFDNHILWAWEPGGQALWQNGIVTGFAFANITLNTHSVINIGAAGSGGNVFWGWLKEAKIWDNRRSL